MIQNVNKSQLKLFKDIAALPCQKRESGSDFTQFSRERGQTEQMEELKQAQRNLKRGTGTDL